MEQPRTHMTFNCNLELSLSLSPPSSSSSSTSNGHHGHLNLNLNLNHRHPHLLLTDLTDLQARAIILRPRRWIMRAQVKEEEEEEVETATSNSSLSPSMMRSLQRFLHKRNQRIHTLSSPYSHYP